MNVVLLQPYRASTPPALVQRASTLAAALSATSASAGVYVRVVQTLGDTPPQSDDRRYSPHARARNLAIAAHLRPGDETVLWVDVDLIDYPPDLLVTLIERNPDGIAAPLIFHDRSGYHYDIAGFIEAGDRSSTAPPYFRQDGTTLHLDSVGCLYTIPAWLYREPWNVRYDGIVDDRYTEHWPVMEGARRLGVPIRAYRDLRAVHAWLPAYGLPHS